MADWWWKPSLDADLLALVLARQDSQNAITFDALKVKFIDFKRTHLKMLEILERSAESVELLGSRVQSSLWGTQEEYEDFKFDGETLYRYGGLFSKRTLDIRPSPCKVARHVYTAADIKNLDVKLDWQILIMNTLIDVVKFKVVDNSGKSASNSQNKLRRLLGSFPQFISRKRVYYKNEPRQKLNGSSRKKGNVEGVHDSGIDLAASMKIRPGSIELKNLFSVDFVNFEQQNVIVSIQEEKTLGVLHFLSKDHATHPLTETRGVDPSKHDTEVSIVEKCTVHMVGIRTDTEKSARGYYNFPLESDFFAFQSALRGKVIRHSFEVDYVHSNRGSETSQQQLKFWSNADNDDHTFSFFVKHERTKYMEFSLDYFIPSANPKHKDPNELRIYFRVPNQRSTGTIETLPGSPRSRSIREIVPFTNTLTDSTASSPKRSFFDKLTKSRRPSEGTSISLSPPVGRVDPRTSSSSGPIGTQGSETTTIDSDTSNSAVVHPYAEAMQYLDIKFSVPDDVQTFKTAFCSPIRTDRRRPHFRGQSIYVPSEKEPTNSKDEEASKEHRASRQMDIATSPARKDETSILSVDLGTPISELSVDNIYSIPGAEGHSIADQAFAFDEEENEVNESKPEHLEVEHQTLPASLGITVPPLSSNQVYRVRGIPIECNSERFKRVLASQLGICRSDIDLRSLATTYPSQKTQTAIVIFEILPLTLSSGESKWSFRWKFSEMQRPSNIQIDTHFHGLTMLCAPKIDIKHEIDICVVAGLGESVFNTFEDRENGGSYMWVLDLLQVYFGRARIMIYGCDIATKRTGSESVLKTMAEGLIDHIQNLDDDTGAQASDIKGARHSRVPLIFIGYSVAGLVIKEAMVLSHEQNDEQEEYGNFKKSVCGFLFFGVPSQALEPNALQTILQDQAIHFSDLSNTQYMQALNNNFKSLADGDNLILQYFYETEKTVLFAKAAEDWVWRGRGNAILLVDLYSATNTAKSEFVNARNFHPIERDHLRLVKWKANDPEEIMVVRILKAMKTRTLARLSSFPPEPRPMLDLTYSSRTGTGFSQPLRRSTHSTARPPGYLSVKDFHVGWICAVGPEYVVALELLDTRLLPPYDLPEDDENSYSFGTIGNMHVVIAGLAKGRYGLISATEAATHMQRSFKINIGLMVGIAGGAPSKRKDIRLGDVVVSEPKGQRGGVFRYDCGRTIQNQEFVIQGSLNSPPSSLLTALNTLSAYHRTGGHHIKTTIEEMLRKNQRLRSEYQKPSLITDVLYKSSFIHTDSAQSCADLCFAQKNEIEPRPERDPENDDPVIHFGLIASGDQLMKDALVRDALVAKEEVLCFETEAGGLMNRFPCLVIRGICDYSDTHKNDIWQGYAAATAGAYAKELLLLLSESRSRDDSKPATQILDEDLPTQGSGAQATELSAGDRIELFRAENVNLRIQLDEAHVRLLYSRISHQSEAQGRQSEAQIRHILQGGLEAVQKTYFQLVTNYKSRLSKYDAEKVKLLEDIRIAEELAASQKQLIEIYEARDRQQQQPACHLVEGSSLLSQHNYHNHSSQYLTYPLPRRQDFNIDPTHLHPLNDLDYSIVSPLELSNTDAVMSALIAEFENQAPILPLQSTPHPTPAEHDVPEPNYIKSDGNKRGPEDEGVKFKKRKTR